MLKYLFTFILSFTLFSQTLYAINSEDIPKSLKEWRAWVLDDVKDRDCPIHFTNGQRICSYPTEIEVDVKSGYLSFKMMVAVFKNRQRVTLPNAYQNWVKEVMVDGKEAVVLGGDVATVILDEGEHIVEGRLAYRDTPKYLQLPKSMALVTLYSDGEKVAHPKVDEESRLWLNENQQSTDKKGTLSVSIYRKLIDGHPMKMRTNLHFRVSGKMRSVLLDGIVLEGFLPSSLSSKLDAKITKDKKLEVQVKAGEWVVNIDSFSSTNLFELKPPNYTFHYANQEMLSLQRDASYRTIEVVDGQTIDPTQTNIPKGWRALPLYLLERDKGLKIKELYKSAKQQQRNDFTLRREVWLDFDGQGYSIKDHINATISKVKRLESREALELGSVTINSKPMLINSLKGHQQKGVELREKSMSIEASSRYEKSIDTLPINGWSEEFNRVSIKLNLPPGWRLFASFGSDAEGVKAWVDKWNLMDIFLVLLLSISIFQLFGFKWSLPATLFLLLLWHENNAPTLIWLWLLALVALIRVLDKGRIKKILQAIFVISSIFVILSVLQFSVDKIRATLYPQLERDSYVEMGNLLEQDSASVDYEDNMIIKSARPMVKKVIRQESISNYSKKDIVMPKRKQILMQNRVDPKAIVQTGEGTPTWSWTQHTFSWQSAVGSNDKLELWFITPIMSKILNILTILGMMYLLFMFLQDFIQTSLKGLKDRVFVGGGLKALLLISLMTLSSQSLKADEIPNMELLKELKGKLTKPPACLPNCASIEQMEVLVKDNDTLMVNMRISSGADISVPILGNRNIWLPQKVSVNGSNKSYLQLDNGGDLWVMLRRGVHDIELMGSVEGLNQIMLSSQLPIHNLTTKKSDLWKINSDNKSYIELISLDKKSTQSREKLKSAIEPMVEITRTFYFGLRWYIETEVKLLNQIDKPYTLRYRLLENESVLNKEIEVEDREAILHLRNSHKRYSWRSSLAITPQLHLLASSQNQITEIWKMDISSMWNMNYKGLQSDSQVAKDNLLMPTFRPWRGETLTVDLESVKAVKGESLTIESNQLNIVQSQRYRDLTLTLKLKSSRAEQYVVSIENLKELTSVKIDGVAHYLKINSGKISLPLKAKAQTVVIKWKEESTTQNIYSFSDINLSKESVNSSLSLVLPSNRWILWTKGALLGPAVLLWGVLLAILLFALILGRIEGSPLKVRDWLLLGLGVSTSSVMIMLPIVAWISLLRYRELKGDRLGGVLRNIVQVLIVITTVVALITMVGAVSVGLLGNPDMMIQGNNSYGLNLHWYLDRVGEKLAEPTVISISIWYYRALMLLWAIWISFSLIKWLKWAWSIFSSGDMWVRGEKKVKKVE